MYQRGTLQRFDYPDGRDLTDGTLRVMAELVRDRSEDVRIRRRALQVLGEYGVASMDYDAQISALYDWIGRNVRYVRDPLGAEHVTDPVELDHQVDDGTAGEDCESLATYAATLLAAIGLRSEFELQAKDQRRPEVPTHCSLRVLNPRTREWVSFDLVGAAAYPDTFGIGDTLAQAGERIERWNLDGQRQGENMRLAGLVSANDFCSGLGDVTSTISDVTSSTAQGAAAGATVGGGYGAIIGGVLNLAGSIVSAVTGKPLGTALPGGPVTVGQGAPIATVGVEHKIDLPTVSDSSKKWLVGIGVGAAALYVVPKILGARVARRGGR